MSRKHFLESMERENDYQKEYEKLEALCGTMIRGRYSSDSVNNMIDRKFLRWNSRNNYCTYEELRNQLGFSNQREFGVYTSLETVDLNRYLLFCEMIINLICDLHIKQNEILCEMCHAIENTINATVEKIGMEIIWSDEEYIIVEKNAVATHVADIMPELSEAVIEYNHYLLKGDMTRKKELLKAISDKLEPKRKTLNGICKGMSDDFFDLVNTMDIRHNNLDSSDTKKYNPVFAKMSVEEREAWYDLIYEQGLALVVMLDQQERNRLIKEYKSEE